MKETDIKSIGAEIRAEGSANRIAREWLSNGLGEEAGDFEGDSEVEEIIKEVNSSSTEEPEEQSDEEISEQFKKQRPSAIGGDSKIPVGNTGTNARRDRNLEKSGSGEE